MKRTPKEITRSALIGQAIGDAFGVPVEFLSRGAVRAINLTDMTGCDTPHDFESAWSKIIPAGAWSDDTSMTVAAMASIANSAGKIDYNDIMKEFVEWWYNGKHCSLDRPFGLGNVVSRALDNFRRGTPAVDCGPRGQRDNGNGALMRILPFALYCVYNGLDDGNMVKLINTASGITHGHEISKMGCVIFTVFLRALLKHDSIEGAWHETRKFNYGKYFYRNIQNAYAELFLPGFMVHAEQRIAETGYIVDTLMTAVYSLRLGRNFEEAIRTAVGMGYDTDTAAAVTGALAGACYGMECMPGRWLERLLKRPELEMLADRFTDAICN